MSPKLDYVCSWCGAPVGLPCTFRTGRRVFDKAVPHEVRGRVVSTAPTPLTSDGVENHVGEALARTPDVADTATPLRLKCGHVASFRESLRGLQNPTTDIWCSYCFAHRERAS